MTIDRALRGIAGFFILLTLGLAWKFNGVNLAEPTWLWFTAFVGVNNFQSFFTGWCPMMGFLKMAGLKS